MKKSFILIVLVCCYGLGQAQHISPQPFGINVHNVSDEVLQKVKDAGISWIRVDINWAHIETEEGNTYFENVDRVVNFARDHALSVLAVLSDTPSWANSGRGKNYPADDVADWERFVTTAVIRYRDRIRYWNIWNEPNIKEFWAEGMDEFVDKIFLPAARAIKAADPGAFIAGPELAHLRSPGKEWWIWMRYLLPRCEGYLDIVSHHIYESLGADEIFRLLEDGELGDGAFVPSVVDVLEETGQGNKPFWITETGWETATFSEQEQAGHYLDLLELREANHFPDKIFFYSIIDDPDPDVPPWGILREDLSEKPAYTIYQDFIAGENLEPEDGSDDSDDPCASEDILANEGASGAVRLARLRGFRDHILNHTANGAEWVSLYYRFSNELRALFSRDRRLSRQVAAVVGRLADVLYPAHQLDLDLIVGQEDLDTMVRVADLILEKEISISLRRWTLWGRSQLMALRGTTVQAYLTVLSQTGPGNAIAQMGRRIRTMPVVTSGLWWWSRFQARSQSPFSLFLE